jgi:hypothetical protein
LQFWIGNWSLSFFASCKETTMFCARCGQQIPDASETCPLCGREATIEVPLHHDAAQAAVAVASAPDGSTAQPIRKDLQGVGGWLLVFCIATTILSPVAVLNALALAGVEFNPAILVPAAMAVFGMVVGITVWTRSAMAIPMLRIYFLVVGGFTLFNLSFLLTRSLEADNEFTIVAYVRTLIFVAVWAAYFHKSERVRATFGRNL